MRARRGRGAQLAAGAARATSDAILFLHADSRLPPRYGAAVAAALASAPWACFAAARPTGLPPAAASLIAACVQARTRLLGAPYGDQALVVRRPALAAAGGVDAALPLMEDVDLVDRLTRAHGRGAVVPAAVATSGRRWATRGVVRATVANVWTLARWRCGARVEDLAAEYYRKTEGRRP